MKKAPNINIKNKRAQHDYLVLDTWTAGIVLTGTEIKSIRDGKAGLVDTFCFIHDHEVWVKNMYVAEYINGTYNNHQVRRDRKLLLNRKEIRHLESETHTPGLTIVPLKIYIDENGRAKLDIGLCKGKKKYDKRASLKDRQDQREIDRIRKGHSY